MTLTALPTKKTMAVTDPRDLTILIYGPPKIGKTTFCSEMGDPLFLTTEPGTKTLDTFEVNIKDWQTMLDVCNLLAKGNNQYKMIVIDTIDQLYWMCSQHVCKKHGIEHESESGFGKGYAFVMNEFKRVINALSTLPYGLVMTSHSQMIQVDDRTGDHSKVTTTLTGKAKSYIAGFVDMILYFDSVTKVVEGETTEIRVIKTKPSKYLEAGDRTGKLPPILKMDVGVFYKAMGVALDTNSVVANAEDLKKDEELGQLDETKTKDKKDEPAVEKTPKDEKDSKVRKESKK